MAVLHAASKGKHNRGAAPASAVAGYCIEAVGFGCTLAVVEICGKGRCRWEVQGRPEELQPQHAMMQGVARGWRVMAVMLGGGRARRNRCVQSASAVAETKQLAALCMVVLQEG